MMDAFIVTEKTLVTYQVKDKDNKFLRQFKITKNNRPIFSAFF